MTRSKRISLLMAAVIIVAGGAIFWANRPRPDFDQSRYWRMKHCIIWLITEPEILHPSTYTDAAGNELFSWRYRTFVLMRQRSNILDDNVPLRLKASWKDTSNKIPREAIGPDEFCEGGKRNSCVLAVTGPDTAFDTSRFLNWLELNKNLLILVEGEAPGIHWMEPGDLDVSKIPASAVTLSDAGISLESSDEVYIAFADGEVWKISGQTPLATLQNFMTATGASLHDRDKELGRYRCVTKQRSRSGQ